MDVELVIYLICRFTKPYHGPELLIISGTPHRWWILLGTPPSHDQDYHIFLQDTASIIYHYSR